MQVLDKGAYYQFDLKPYAGKVQAVRRAQTIAKKYQIFCDVRPFGAPDDAGRYAGYVITTRNETALGHSFNCACQKCEAEHGLYTERLV